MLTGPQSNQSTDCISCLQQHESHCPVTLKLWSSNLVQRELLFDTSLVYNTLRSQWPIIIPDTFVEDICLNLCGKCDSQWKKVITKAYPGISICSKQALRTDTQTRPHFRKSPIDTKSCELSKVSCLLDT